MGIIYEWALQAYLFLYAWSEFITHVIPSYINLDVACSQASIFYLFRVIIVKSL